MDKLQAQGGLAMVETKSKKKPKAKPKVEAPVESAQVHEGPELSVKIIGIPKAGIVDSVDMSLDGKTVSVPCNMSHKIKLSAFRFTPLTEKLFAALSNHLGDKWEFAYKPVYGCAFGVIPKGLTGYKAGICQHFNRGTNSICLNANSLNTIAKIGTVLEKHGVRPSTEKKTWKLLHLTEENYSNVVEACKELM